MGEASQNRVSTWWIGDLERQSPWQFGAVNGSRGGGAVDDHWDFVTLKVTIVPMTS